MIWFLVAPSLLIQWLMSELGFTGLERAVAACLLCARAMAARDPKIGRKLRLVIAMLESAHEELARPDASRAAA